MTAAKRRRFGAVGDCRWVDQPDHNGQCKCPSDSDPPRMIAVNVCPKRRCGKLLPRRRPGFTDHPHPGGCRCSWRLDAAGSVAGRAEGQSYRYQVLTAPTKPITGEPARRPVSYTNLTLPTNREE